MSEHLEMELANLATNTQHELEATKKTLQEVQEKLGMVAHAPQIDDRETPSALEFECLCEEVSRLSQIIETQRQSHARLWAAVEEMCLWRE